MTSSSSLRAVALVGITLYAVPAWAQASRTYVSSTGTDANSCTAAAPCQTFQYALSRTSPGGKIVALNSGSYGPLAITQSVAIASSRGVGGIVPSSSGSGITINAGPNDVVDLRGLEIQGSGSDTAGIQFNSGGTLQVHDSVIRGFVTGVSFQPNAAASLLIEGTVLSANSTALSFQSSASLNGVLSRVQATNNNDAIVASGLSTGTLVSLSVRNSVVANNNSSGILSNGNSVISVIDTTIASNATGIASRNANAWVQISGTTVSGNAIGWVAASNGQVISKAKNSIGGNTSGDSAPPKAGRLPVPSSPPTGPTASPPPTPPPPATNYIVDESGGFILDANGLKMEAS